jgi:hypothetical protein
MTEHVRESAPATAARAPGQVRVACVILLVEVAALVAAMVVLLVETFAGNPDSIGRALSDAGLAAAGAVLLLLGVRGLARLRPAARTPVIVMQLLALPVAYSLAFQAHRVAYGGPILIAALAVIYLLFTPPARTVLDRDISR